MKPEILEFCGINSFSERAVIDFKDLTQFGIFGIFGDTGSGKSTVLDCISFALYGDVARSKGSLAEIINYRLDKAYVNFEFEIYYEGVRRTFRVEREIKRKNAVQSVRVYERKGETLSALSEGVRESNALLLRIIGLEQRDFEKCIALPQGEFAQFVKSARAERLKLVSRLFNLEKYGEGLFKRTNAKFCALREEGNVLKARLEQYEDISKASVKALKEEISSLKAEETALKALVERERAEERRLSALLERAEERAALAEKMSKLEERKEAMKALDRAVSKLEKAAAVFTRQRELSLAGQKREADERAALQADERYKRAQRVLEALPAWDAEGAEAEIERLSANLVASKEADFKRRQYDESKERAEKILSELDREKNAFHDFSYAEESEALERALLSLGDDGDFLSFAQAHGKAALLRGEYAVFADELKTLTQKHRPIEDDTRPLIRKYEELSAGERTDFSSLREEYDARRKEREGLQQQRLALERAKSRYDMHLNTVQALSTEYKTLADRMKELAAQCEGVAPFALVDRQLKEKRAQAKQYEAQKREAEEGLNRANLERTAASERLASSRQAEQTALAYRDEALRAGEFENVDDARRLFEHYGNAEEAKRRVEAYKEEYAAVHARLRELSREQGEDVTRERLAAFTRKLKDDEELCKNCSGKLAVASSALERSEEALKKKQTLEERYEAVRGEGEKFERLKKLLEGNKFMEFVAEEYLQTVALNASKRLLSLTGGRYFLRYEGGFFVGDNFDGGNARAVTTLSGGETFLVSLSLAIALSAEICARSLRPIEFFFLDEGFGTLDEKLVDVVMDSLEKLKGEHLTVGIISHVEELKHRINRKLFVAKATEKHGSQILTE